MPDSGTEEKKICFVVQGFGEKTDFTDGRKLNLDASYQVIKEAVEEAGLKCLRADEIKHSGTIDQPMYEHILHADLVVADLSTYNVNAAYELGVRYGLRPCAIIIVAEEQFKNPFDVSHIVIRRYKHLGEDIGVSEARRFKKELKDAISEIVAAEKTDSPVYTFLKTLRPPVEETGDKTYTVAAAVPASINVQHEQSAKDLFDKAHSAKAKGDFVLAKALLQAIRQIRPNDDYVVQQLALVTYKSKQPDQRKALEEARAILKALNPETSNDPETLGLWGAVHKRLWEISGERTNLDESIGAYERGFYLKQDYYNGINLAFLLNIRSAQEEGVGNNAEAIADFILARRVRREVLGICEKALESGPESDADKYWILATLWEANVGLENDADASKWGEQARATAIESWMLNESTLPQLEKLKTLLAASPLKHLRP
jgi:hypothetical protein